MKKRIISWLLTAALVIGLFPAASIKAAAAELAEAYTLSDDYISVSVSKRNGGFTVKTVEGDRLKKSDNHKDLLYHDGQYDTSFLSLRVGQGSAAKDYLFGGSYPGSSKVAVTEANGVIQAVWSVDGLTFTQSISLANTSSNESGMVSLSVSVKNSSGSAVPVQARVLYDTALGSIDYGYYQYMDSSQQTAAISSEQVLTTVPDQIFATDDPYSPSVAAYTVSSGTVKPYKAAFGHWSHLAGTLFDFAPTTTLDFTSSRNEYLTADSAYALYYNLGSVANGGSASLNTFYGVFSNHQTPASNSVAVNLTAPIRLRLNDAKDNFVPESNVKGSAHFAVSVDFMNIPGENAKDMENLVLAVQTTGNLRPLDDNGNVDAQHDFTSTAPYTFPYASLKVGASQSKTLYFQAKPGTDAAYERITVGVYDYSSGQLAEDKKLGERMAYVLLPGSDNDVPKVHFASMTPKIIYNAGTRHLFATISNETMLASESNWNLKAYSEDGKVNVPIPHENITIKDGVMDVALTDSIRLSEGGWYLRLEWTDAAVAANLVPAAQRCQTAPELHFTVSSDKKYKNDSYGILAVVKYQMATGGTYRYSIESFKDEAAFKAFKDDKKGNGSVDKYDEILLTFKGEFTATRSYSSGGEAQGVYYTAVSTKTMGTDGKTTTDNPIIINDCMDFEGGTLDLYYENYQNGMSAALNSSICTEFDGELYTNEERTSIWSGKAVFTKIEQGKKFSLIPYNENGERGSYELASDGKRKLNTDAPQNFTDKTISLIWPSAAGIGQTLSGMIFKLAYGQLGIMYDTQNQTNIIEGEVGRVVSFTASLDLTFASGKVDPNRVEEPTYWSEMRELWRPYDTVNDSTSLYRYMEGNTRFQQATDWSQINESGMEDNKKHVKGSVMVRDVLFGCGEGFVGVNFTVGVAIKNYVEGLPEIEGTIAVNTINNWSYGIEGKIDLATFTVEAKVAFKSNNNVPIPDELYVFVSGFQPGINIDGCGVVWITGGGGGIKNIYDSIYSTQAVPPLKLLLSVSFDIVKVLSCEKATLGVGLTGISLQAEKIGIKNIPGMTAIERMGLSLEWYPGIDLRANMTVNLFQGVIQGGGYIVLISPDYSDVFFEMFARARLMVPASVPVVGGMQLMGADLGISTEKIWGALEVLFITLGVTYYWGEDSVNFGSGSKTQPTFPDLLGYDSIPVYYDEENGRTLYARVGTNTQLMASSADTGEAVLMDSNAVLYCTDGENKTKYQFNLGTRRGDNDAIVQITFNAADLAAAKTLAQSIAVADDSGTAYGIQLFDTSKPQTDPANANANANLTFADGKATLAFTASQNAQYEKNWSITGLPKGTDVLLYNVNAVPEVTAVSGSANGGSISLTWQGSELSELDQISFYLCDSNDPESTAPGYRIGAVEDSGTLAGGSTSLTVPADVPSGEYYVRAVYSKSDEVNGAAYSTVKVRWTNSDTPGEARFTAKAAGNLQYELNIQQAANTDGYLVTVYDANGSATDFEQVSYAAEQSGATVIKVGGSYTAMDENKNTQQFGLTGGRSYTIGVTPYKTVTSGQGESAVYGREAKSDPITLPVPKTPALTFSADKTAHKRTETNGENGQSYTMDVYTANALTITASASEAVSGEWRLDESGTTTPFDSTSKLSIPLSGLSEGEHTLTVSGTAADGDGFAASYRFVTDTLPPQLLVSSPVNGSYFNKDGTVTITGITDADARLTVTSGGATLYGGKTVTRDAKTGTFSLKVNVPDPNNKFRHTISVYAEDDVGNRTAVHTADITHGGLADLKELKVKANGQIYDTGNLPVPASGLAGVPLTLVGVTSSGTVFDLTGCNIIWELVTAEGTAKLEDGKLTAEALSQGIVTGKLAVAQNADSTTNRVTSTAYRTATLCFGAPADHMVAVSTTVGGKAAGGGSYQPGQTVTLTAVPDSGYRFAGWTLTGISGVNTASAAISFAMPAAGNVTALARFEPVTSSSGGSSSGGGLVESGETVTAKQGELVRVKLPAGKGENDFVPILKDGTNTLVPVSAVVNGEMTFIAPKSGTYGFAANPNRFTDIGSHWAKNDIAYCAAREIFKGVSDTRFNPNGTMTRAMFVTVLYRMAGSPAAQRVNFRDVAAGAWYADAVSWASANGIVKGYGDNRFGPNDLVTRAQMCTLLKRFVEQQGYTLAATAPADTFRDAAQLPSWAAEAVAYCQTRGLVNGRDGGVFAPMAGATRAENCAVFHRLIPAILSAKQ